MFTLTRILHFRERTRYRDRSFSPLQTPRSTSDMTQSQYARTLKSSVRLASLSSRGVRKDDAPSNQSYHRFSYFSAHPGLQN